MGGLLCNFKYKKERASRFMKQMKKEKLNKNLVLIISCQLMGTNGHLIKQLNEFVSTNDTR